jgi:hypothetical protein
VSNPFHEPEERFTSTTQRRTKSGRPESIGVESGPSPQLANEQWRDQLRPEELPTPSSDRMEQISLARQLKRLPKKPPASYSSVSVAHWWNSRSETVAEAFSRSSEFSATTYWRP